ncbi:hypothetical protein GOQ29_06015 [Clostridium sp. D2Q-14]|nr:hypothetical protein [Anaeromonas gelatinilytica]MBS4535175.1 hypothetical protein [Anaeromonas gelatinilytica]
MEKEKFDLIVNELYESLKVKEVTYAEATEVLNKLRNKLYASAKLK